MNSDNDLLKQPGTVQQQPPPMKKKSNIIWIATVISLLAVNLQYINFQYSWYGKGHNAFEGTFLHLSALLAVDLVSASLYLGEKRNLNWKVIFLLLFMCNLISFPILYEAIANLDFYRYLPLVLLAVLPHFSILLVVDFIAAFIKKHPHDNRAYIALLIVTLVLFFLGIGLYQMSFFGLSTRTLRRFLL